MPLGGAALIRPWRHTSKILRIWSKQACSISLRRPYIYFWATLNLLHNFFFSLFLFHKVSTYSTVRNMYIHIKDDLNLMYPPFNFFSSYFLFFFRPSSCIYFCRVKHIESRYCYIYKCILINCQFEFTRFFLISGHYDG